MMEHNPVSRRKLLQVGAVAATAVACQGCRLFGSRKPDAVVKQEDGRIRLSPEESAKLQAEGGVLVKVTVSAGISTMADNDDSVQALIKRADMALYQAKQGGRNQIATMACQPV